jgi:hypothetical protein
MSVTGFIAEALPNQALRGLAPQDRLGEIARLGIAFLTRNRVARRAVMYGPAVRRKAER